MSATPTPSAEPRVFCVEARVVPVQSVSAPPPARFPDWRVRGWSVALAVVSPLSAIVVYFIARSFIGSSNQQRYIMSVGVPRMISYVTSLPLSVWLLVGALRGAKRFHHFGVQCICWWMIVQGVFFIYSFIYSTARGLNLLDEQYEGAEREHRSTYLTLQLAGTVPDVLLGMTWLLLLLRVHGGGAICCCGGNGAAT